MPRSIALAGCLLVALAGSTACSGDEEPSGLPELGTTTTTASPTASASASAPAPPTPSSGGLADEAGVTAGSVKATGAGKAVAQAWVSYWRERTLAYHDVTADRPELAAVATPEQVRLIGDRVAVLREKKIHTVGTAVINVSKVAVSGSRATIASCMENRTIDVNARLQAVEPPTPYYAMKGTAIRSGDAWKVSGVEISDRGFCS